MHVTEDVVETGTGKKLTFGIVHKDPMVLIIPWDGKYLTLVGQYRYATDNFSWEFPAGHLVQNSIEQTAHVELKEETGLSAGGMRAVGEFDLANGHHTQRCHVYLATDLTVGEPNRDEGEAGMVSKKVTPAELKQLIIRGVIKDGPTIAATSLLLLKDLLRS